MVGSVLDSPTLAGALVLHSPSRRVAALGDEQLLAQNIPFCAATAESPAGAEFVHIGGYLRGHAKDQVALRNGLPRQPASSAG
jgi:hypothetical protein